MSKLSNLTKNTNENSGLENDTKKEIELMEEFDETMVEPLNFIRKNLLEQDDCLSYL